MLVARTTISNQCTRTTPSLLFRAYLVWCQSAEGECMILYAHSQHGPSWFGIGCQGSLIGKISTRHKRHKKQHVTIFK